MKEVDATLLLPCITVCAGYPDSTEAEMIDIKVHLGRWSLDTAARSLHNESIQHTHQSGVVYELRM